jgi:tetratricopeptide (TPR) repeat protein
MKGSNSTNAAARTRIAALKQFVIDDPADDFSRYALALELEKTGSVKDAIAHLEHVVQRNPGYLAAYYQLGKNFEAQQEIGRAAAAYARGIEIAKQQSNTKTLNELRSALDLLDI